MTNCRSRPTNTGTKGSSLPFFVSNCMLNMLIFFPYFYTYSLFSFIFFFLFQKGVKINIFNIFIVK